ncbi:MAG: DUF1343 domain-containing protein [Candidatus Eremiobacteraeota bacterium]|nr:DUF1343 domain-containing protein [Candidatus Eremiobacteraeota bacterium]
MAVPVFPGIDVLLKKDFEPLAGASVGLLVNQASVDRNLVHTARHFLAQRAFSLKALFGPQHGIYGTTQDNMIEWEGFNDQRARVPVFSLYGAVREPTDEMLEGLDTLVIDLPDVGARYYTFIWTALFMLRKCIKKGIRVVVLDRPNPINGKALEGPLIEEGYRSFVGLYPIIIRHGMTIGELMAMMYREEAMAGKLIVITMEGWRRSMWHDDTHLPWVMPSPNMPTLDTAVVYPGFCLLEGTAISEGRGTTRPFEFFGAPFIEPELLCADLEAEQLPGVHFRPAWFEPTFQKHRGELCGGAQVHVTDREKFMPILTAVAVLKAVVRRWGEKFRWKEPPYEYEYEKLPFDILAGSPRLRQAICEDRPLAALLEEWQQSQEDFRKRRQEFLLYE